MPELTFERDVQRDHPIVDDLCRDDFSTSLLIRFVEPGSSHLGVYVVVDPFDVLAGEFVVDLSGNILIESHSHDVPEDLFRLLLL